MMRRETMKTLMLAAAAALSLSAGVAHANEGSVVAQAQARNVPSTEANGSDHSQVGHGPWLFPPIGKYLNQRAGG
jgi:hypothetical protein